jgi:hypothetical protein
VPLGSDGEEADFNNCGIVAVAVPESRQPPAPRLDGTVDPATGSATLLVSTNGVDLVALRRDEPGLFEPGEPGTKPPLATIRRAVGSVADPIYAKPVGEPVAMGRGADADRFASEHLDDNDGQGLEPFVHYVYWAEWRMPPERRAAGGVSGTRR